MGALFRPLRSPQATKLVPLTLPRSMMKQSPRLKLAQAMLTSAALMARRPLMCSRRLTFMSLVTTCWKPDATPPFCARRKKVTQTYVKV